MNVRPDLVRIEFMSIEGAAFCDWDKFAVTVFKNNIFRYSIYGKWLPVELRSRWMLFVSIESLNPHDTVVSNNTTNTEQVKKCQNKTL